MFYFVSILEVWSDLVAKSDWKILTKIAIMVDVFLWSRLALATILYLYLFQRIVIYIKTQQKP